MSQESVFTSYDEHLRQIGVSPDVSLGHGLTDVIFHKAIRIGYNEDLIRLWSLGRDQTILVCHSDRDSIGYTTISPETLFRLSYDIDTFRSGHQCQDVLTSGL